MATLIGQRSRAPRGGDRFAFLGMIGLVWIGVLSGFGTDSFAHVRAHGLDYPWIVHLHAILFVGWLTLFTVQAGLIAEGRVAQHKRLGQAGAALAAAMLVIGPVTAVIVDAADYAARGRTPEFLAIQLTDMLAFAGLTGAGLWLRERADAHKRLMLMGLFAISNAGFARYLSGFAAAPLGHGALGGTVRLFFGSFFLIFLLGAYDIASRGRLYRAYVLGLIWCVGVAALGAVLLASPAWKPVAMALIGR